MLFTRRVKVQPKGEKRCLSAYLDLWNDLDFHLPKDMNVLPCEKSILKTAILQELAGGPYAINKLQVSLYRRLALNQRLTSTESKAIITAYAHIGALSAKSGVFGAAEKSKLSMLMYANEDCARVMARVAKEDRKLQEDLVNCGCLSKLDQEAEWREIAHLASAQNAKLGIPTVVTAADVQSSHMPQGVR